jgi:hypothetical protein
MNGERPIPIIQLQSIRLCTYNNFKFAIQESAFRRIQMHVKCYFDTPRFNRFSEAYPILLPPNVLF